MTTLADCLSLVSTTFGISKAELLSERRQRRVSHPRQIGYWLAKHTTTASFPLIARVFNRADHTTVMHGCEAVEDRRAHNPEMRALTDILRDQLMGGDVDGRGSTDAGVFRILSSIPS